MSIDRSSVASAAMRRAVMLAGLGLLLVAVAVTGCGSKGGAGGDPLKYLPAEASMVVDINLGRLRQTQFKDRLLQLRDRSESLKKSYNDLAQKAGLDLLRDVDSLAIGLPYQPASSDMALVAIGRFNQDSIITWFKTREGAKIKDEKHGKHTVYLDEDRNYYLSFLSSTTLLVGSKDWIHKMLDLADGKGQAVRSRADMADLFARVKPNQVVWLAARFPEDLRKKAKEADSAFKGVTGVIATVDFAAGMELDFRADTEADADASRLTEKFNNLVKEMRESPWLGALALTPMLQDVKGAQEGKVFHARAALPQQQLDELIKKIEEIVKQKLGDMPRLQLPGPEQGGPSGGEPSSLPAKPGASAPAPAEGEPKAAPGGGTPELPQLKLSPPGGAKEKRRPGLLGP
ncbi:MAG TPA: hypothetical protein VGQ83_25680 [Polyangia bacterium]